MDVAFSLQGSRGVAIFAPRFPAVGDVPGGQVWNYIRYKLATHSGLPHVTLASLHWSLFAQLSPADFTSPVAKGVHQMLAGSSLLEIALVAADVPKGWYMLVLADMDRTTTVASPVMVV